MNYLFAAVWIGDVIWSWLTPVYAVRPVWVNRAVRGFFWFMIFNGAVVFVHGALRVYGLVLSLALIACWYWQCRSGDRRYRTSR